MATIFYAVVALAIVAAAIFGGSAIDQAVEKRFGADIPTIIERLLGKLIPLLLFFISIGSVIVGGYTDNFVLTLISLGFSAFFGIFLYYSFSGKI